MAKREKVDYTVGQKSSEGAAAIRRSSPTLPTGYGKVLQGIKERVRSAQLKASLSVNRELVVLYWDIGRRIVERQTQERWGSAVIERLASDLQGEFPGMKGFSANNIWRMRAFYLAYSQSPAILARPVQEIGDTTVPRPVADIPWGHNVTLVQRVKDPVVRLWYARMTLEHGWSRNILDLQIESDLHGRQGKAVTNFTWTLPAPQSDLAQQTLKDPYMFDFLTLPPLLNREVLWNCGTAGSPI